MKKLIFMGVLGLFLLGSCNSKSGHDHEGHDHGTEEAHNHDHEGHDHNHEGHDHEKENHDHENEGHEGHNHEAEASAAGHSDEIILAPEKAKAAGVESEIIRPESFRQIEIYSDDRNRSSRCGFFPPSGNGRYECEQGGSHSEYLC